MSLGVSLGDAVLINIDAYDNGKHNTNFIGLVKFIGVISGLASAVYYGLELLHSIQNGHNGIIKKQKYFQCEQGHGIHIKQNQIIRKLTSAELFQEMKQMVIIHTKDQNTNNNNNTVTMKNVSGLVQNLVEIIDNIPSDNNESDLSDLKHVQEYKSNDSSSMELKHSTDHYKGIRMVNDPTQLPLNQKEFEEKLKYSMQKWKTNGKRGCWIKLTKPIFDRLSFCVSLGFKPHHAKPDYIMLQTWLADNEKTMIPVFAYSYIGAHAFIINSKNEMVVMREHYGRDNWKIPGGAVDFGEHASVAAVREAKEETGLDCDFLGVLCVRHIIKFRFGNTADISFLCLLRAKDENMKFDPISKNEVADIKWMSVNEYIDDKDDNGHVFLGKEKENLEMLRKASLWVRKYGNDIDSHESQKHNPCLFKYKQTHPWYTDADIAVYHNYRS